MTPLPMIKAHKNPCENDDCSQVLCVNDKNVKKYEIPSESNFEAMCAMSTGDRKKKLLQGFETLEGIGHGLSRTQRVVLAGMMEVRL